MAQQGKEGPLKLLPELLEELLGGRRRWSRRWAVQTQGTTLLQHQPLHQLKLKVQVQLLQQLPPLVLFSMDLSGPGRVTYCC